MTWLVLSGAQEIMRKNGSLGRGISVYLMLLHRVIPIQCCANALPLLTLRHTCPIIVDAHLSLVLLIFFLQHKIHYRMYITNMVIILKFPKISAMVKFNNFYHDCFFVLGNPELVRSFPTK